MRSRRRVVITGTGMASPVGYTLVETCAAVWNGKPNFKPISGLRVAETPVHHAGVCVDPDVKRLPDRKVQKILRRKDVISLLTILETARDAGIGKGTLDPDRTGMYVGASSTQIADLEPYFGLVRECVDLAAGTYDAERFGSRMLGNVNPLVVLQTLMNNSLCFGSMTLDIRGVNANFMDFQASGLRAIGEGYRSIATGRADAVLAGGVATAVEPFQVQEGVDSGYLARTRDLEGPVEAMVRPYDVDRKGAILSEGSAFVLLEEEQAALRRKARILGYIEGFGLATDGVINIMGAHDSPGLGRAVQGALDEATWRATDLGLVVGHGSGSVHGDRAEAKAWTEVLGEARRQIPLVSPKSVLGDLCEAGGVASLIMALASFERGEAPPTHNFTRGDADSAELCIKPEPQKIARRRAVVTARSFLGLSAALVVSL